jgi:hypothetical protein
VGKDRLPDIMDSMGQWEYVVEILCMWALAIWPLYPGEFRVLWRWQTVSCAAWALREGRP